MVIPRVVGSWRGPHGVALCAGFVGNERRRVRPLHRRRSRRPRREHRLVEWSHRRAAGDAAAHGQLLRRVGCDRMGRLRAARPAFPAHCMDQHERHMGRRSHHDCRGDRACENILMKYSKYAVFGVAAILTLFATAARGQESAGTWGFVSAQYNTRSSAYIYTGYGWRGAFAMAGVVNNPRSGYAELLAGVGGVFKTGPEAEHWLAFATARTADVSFAQIYWLPRVHI